MSQMKLILFILLQLFSLFLFSQNGLENIIVEKYYVSDANDTNSSHISGKLPIGSITYRIYLDMLPEYRFYAAYGTSSHELKIETTSAFFNNEYIGATIPNSIPRRTLNRNTVMLDSWLSAGGAGEKYYGILKVDDDTLETIPHEKLYLKNNNKLAGMPLSVRDGMKAVDEIPFPIFFGIDSIATIFSNSSIGGSFITKNGAWGALGGSIGIDSLSTNKLLIAQLTTNGEFSFELNIQIGKRGFPPEYYVAKNAAEKEITLHSLIYNSKDSKLTGAKKKKSTNKNKS